MGAPSWPSQVGNDVHVPAAVGWSKFFKEDLPVDREGQKEPPPQGIFQRRWEGGGRRRRGWDDANRMAISPSCPTLT